MLTKIISGFPAVGKSWLYDNQENLNIKVLDSDSSKFSWIEKGVRNPDFPMNYIQHIHENIGEVDLIMVSTHKEVLDALYDNHFNPLVVYPSIEIKDEYIERYRNRGNDSKFIDFISENWDNFIFNIENDSRFKRYKLKSNQFLKDIPLLDYDKLGMHFVYRNNVKFNDNNNAKCVVCRRKLNYIENYISNNISDICFNCVHDIKNCTPDIKTDSKN